MADIEDGTGMLAFSLALEITEPHIGIRVVPEISALHPSLTRAWTGRVPRCP